MKHFYIVALAALTAVSAQAAAPSETPSVPVLRNLGFKHTKKNASVRRAPARRVTDMRSAVRNAFSPASDEQALWRPGKVKVSFFEGEWVPEEEIAYTYDHDGHILTEVSYLPDFEETVYFNKLVYTYNENGMLATRESYGSDGEEFFPSELTVREYDERVTDFIIDNQTSFWGGDNLGWLPGGNNYRRAVTRDGAGNVTRVEMAIYYLGEYDPTEIIETEFDAEGKPSKITVNTKKTNDGYTFYWKVTAIYDDLKWVRTNGQIVSDEQLMTVANAIASCTYTDEDGDVATVEVEYPDDLGSYVMTMEAEFDGVPAHNRVELTVIDNYGSYSIVQTEVYDYEDEPESFVTTERYLYDEWGQLTEIYAAEVFNDEMEDIWDWSKSEITETDSEYGYPLCYETSIYDPEEEEWYIFMREEKSDYVNCHASDGVAAIPASADSTVRWYDVNGMCVDAGNLTPGLYIRHEGGRVSKVIVR